MESKSNTFSEKANDQYKSLLDTLRHERTKIENNLRMAQQVIHFEDEEAYIQKSSMLELKNLSIQQSRERKRYEARQKAEADELKSRNEMNRLQTAMLKEARQQQNQIHEQDEAREMAVSARLMVQHKRDAFTRRVQYIEQQQARERQELMDAQKRKARVLNVLLDLETRHLPEDKRKSIMKENNLRQQQTAALDAKRSLHLRDVQLMSMKSRTAEFELEISAFEQREALIIDHRLQILGLENQQSQELDEETQRVLAHQDQIQATKAKQIQELGLKQLTRRQKKHYSQVERQQKAQMRKRQEQWRKQLDESAEERSSVLDGKFKEQGM